MAKDYLAVISLDYGCGSWARDADRDNAVKRVVRILKSDWKGIFKFKKGDPIIVNVVDVTGFDDVSWDERGFYAKAGRIDRPIEQVTATL